MLVICNLLYRVLNGTIIVLGVGELMLWVYALRRLMSAKRELGKIRQVESRISWHKNRSRVITETKSVVTRENWEAYIAFRDGYRKKIIPYDIFTTAIQLFTLLGILGTVAGLYIALNSASLSSEGFSYEGIGFALSSTVYGIICAVLFKTVEIVTDAVVVGPIEDTMDLFEKDYGVKNDALKDLPAAEEAK